MSDSSKPTESDKKLLPREVLDEYISIRESARHISDRRDRANSVFTSINALFLTGLGALVTSSSSHFHSWEVVMEVGLITLAISPVNWMWHRILDGYTGAIQKHYAILEQMEADNPFTGKLSTKLTVSGANTSPFKGLVWYFLLLYPVITIVVALLTWLVTNRVIVFEPK